MIVDGQCYIVIAPGMKLPAKTPDGIEFYNTIDDEWFKRGGRMGILTIDSTYRYPVTEAEYRTHHGMLAWPCKCPDDHEVVNFRVPLDGDLLLTNEGNVLLSKRTGSSPMPILRKKTCEHTSTVDKAWVDIEPPKQGYTITCNLCGMVRKLGDWEEAE